MTNTTGHKRQGSHPDCAVNTPDEDRDGFTHIATQLAKAIKGIGREGSAVIRLKSPMLMTALSFWGTGSFTNAAVMARCEWSRRSRRIKPETSPHQRGD